MTIKNLWNVDKYGPLSEEAVRARHQPASHFRVSHFRYPSGTHFSGTMRPGICYLVQGCCRYNFGKNVDVLAGELANLPGGDYDFEVVGAEDVDLILVWQLPTEFQGD